MDATSAESPLSSIFDLGWYGFGRSTSTGRLTNDPGFVARFHDSGRVGFYLRVLKEGVITAGDSIRLIKADSAKLSIGEAMLVRSKGPRRQEIINRALAISALSEAWRRELQGRDAAK